MTATCANCKHWERSGNIEFIGRCKMLNYQAKSKFELCDKHEMVVFGGSQEVEDLFGTIFKNPKRN